MGFEEAQEVRSGRRLRPLALLLPTCGTSCAHIAALPRHRRILVRLHDGSEVQLASQVSHGHGHGRFVGRPLDSLYGHGRSVVHASYSTEHQDGWMDFTVHGTGQGA